MKKLLALILALALVFTVCGCASDTAEAPAQPAENAAEPAADAAKEPADIKIGYICSAMTNQGWLIINDGAQTAAEELGVDFQFVATTQNDTGAWLNAFEDLKNMGCDAIVFGGAQLELVDAIETAVAEGFICVEIDTPSGAEGTYRIGISNYDAAVKGAEWLVNESGMTEGNLICLNGAQTTTSGQERRDGFLNTLAELAPNINVFEVDTEWTQEKALNGAEDALVALNYEADAVYCAWDGGTVAVASVLETYDLTDRVTLIGFDGAADALGLMKEGKVSADIGQPLFRMGYEGVVTALKVALGENIEKGDIQLETTVITPENVDAYIAEAGLTQYVK